MKFLLERAKWGIYRLLRQNTTAVNALTLKHTEAEKMCYKFQEARDIAFSPSQEKFHTVVLPFKIPPGNISFRGTNYLFSAP